MATSTEELVGEYLQWLTIEKGRARATIEAYRRDLLGVVTWLSERGLALSEVREDDLERYCNALRDRLSASTVARVRAALRGWFAYLVDERHLSRDPSAALAPRRHGRTLPKPLREDEVATLLDSVPDLNALDRRDRALLELLYDTGARVSEVVGLNLSDLDFDEELVLLRGKGSKQRLVPLGATLRTVLLDYLEPGARDTLRAGRHTTRLFLNARGGSLSRQGVGLIVHRRALDVGIERTRVSAHVFRHSCATHMLAHGADIRVVQELLGHASIATTQLYTAVSVATLQQAYLDAHPRAHD